VLVISLQIHSSTDYFCIFVSSLHNRLKSSMLIYDMKFCQSVLDNPAYFSDAWGRYPPERRYNMDQVPLPFNVDQQTTFTMGDDSHMHIRGTRADGLSKRQYTWTNAGKGLESQVYIDLIAPGTENELEGLEIKAGTLL
jgi:hypothetical protein